MSAADTLPAAFRRRVAESGHQPAVVFHDGQQFQHWDWLQLGGEASRAAVALVRAGCQPRDRVVQLSENRREWIVADLAIMLARCVHVPLHATLSAAQVQAQIADCQPRVIIVSNQDQADKLVSPQSSRSRETSDTAELKSHDFSYEEGLPAPAIFTHDTCNTPFRPGPDLVRLSDAATEIPDAEADQLAVDAATQTAPGELATVLYTSGTTGEPKGVMLSHGNLVSNAAAMVEAFRHGGSDLRLSLLPWSHVFARTCDLYTWILSGATLIVANRREQILDDCAALSPTLINAVPYFYERLHRRAAELHKLDEPGWLRGLLGGRIRFCCCGGAALQRHVAEWFAAQQVPLVEGYGLSETSPVITAATPDANRIGTVGPPLPGVKVRIASDGEIETRGPHVMLGYYRQPAATAEVLHDGWLRTGDLGRLDADGYLTITGRKKELIVTAAGKNIAPTLIEGLLAADPLIHQAIVFGDGRNYLVALIVPEPDPLRAEIFSRHIALASREEALTHPAVLSLYAERITQRLAHLSRHEQIVRFRLIGRALSQERDELTPTLKLRRSVIAEHFATEIAAMYDDSAK